MVSIRCKEVQSHGTIGGKALPRLVQILHLAIGLAASRVVPGSSRFFG